MTSLNIVLRNLALVHFLLFCEKINCKLLLKQRIALVFLVLQNAHHRSLTPFELAGWRWDMKFLKIFAYSRRSFSINEEPVDQAYNIRFSINDLRLTVLTFLIAEEMLVRHGHLAVGKTLSLTPCDVFGNAATFFLGKGTHDGYKKFTLAVQCVDVLFLKIDLHTLVLQLAHSCKAVHGVSGKTAHAFRNDEICLSGKSIFYHLIKAITVLCVQTTDTLIGIDFYELPLRIAFYEVGVILNLRFVAGLLLIAVRGNTGIPGNAALTKG